MKKLTKTQKTILKKKVLRIFNVVGLVVGGLSFLVVLYALIFGSRQVDHSDVENSPISTDTLKINKALTPPTADFSYYYSTANERFVAYNDFNFDDDINSGDNYAINDKSYFAFNSEGYTQRAIYNHYHNTDKGYYISSDLSFYKTSTLFGSLSENNTEIVPKDNHIQLYQVSDARYDLSIDNKSPYNLKLNIDVSSSLRELGATVVFYTNSNEELNRYKTSIQYENFYYSYTIPAFMKMRIGVLGSIYSSLITSFDAFYLTSLGVSSAYSNGVENNDFYEEGYDSGYGVGYADGYGEGIDVAYDDGYENGYLDGLGIEYDKGYTDGWADGHKNGIDTATTASKGIENAFDLVYQGAKSIDKILSINIFGSITLGMLLFTPLIIGVALTVIKIIKG